MPTDAEIIQELCNHDILPVAEQLALARRWRQEGDVAARDLLERCNYRLVVEIAGRYAFRVGPVINKLDLIHAGIIGLRRASDKFEPERGFAFTTYATYWIRQAVQREAMYNGRTFKLPAHRERATSAIAKARALIEQETSRSATVVEIAERANIPLVVIQRVLGTEAVPVSLDAPAQLGFKYSVGEALVCPQESVEEQVEAGELASILRTALRECGLAYRTVRIMELRYGLVDGHCYTLEEVGNRCKLTRERVRQIEKEALQKLRKVETLRELFEQIA